MGELAEIYNKTAGEAIAKMMSALDKPAAVKLVKWEISETGFLTLPQARSRTRWRNPVSRLD